jgi:hypothetical protein
MAIGGDAFGNVLSLAGLLGELFCGDLIKKSSHP